MKESESILFNPGDVHGNVDMSPRGHPVGDFGLYADHFRDAAYRLAIHLQESAGYSDLDACPIAFLYRHALELYFKHIILKGSNILKLQGRNLPELFELVASSNGKKVFTMHQLGKLFPHVKKVFLEIWGPWPEDKNIPNLEQANKIIDELDKFDRDSYAFRYPTHKDESPTEPRKMMFNILDFSNILHPFCEFLESACTGLSDVYDNLCEYLYNQQDCSN